MWLKSPSCGEAWILIQHSRDQEILLMLGDRTVMQEPGVRSREPNRGNRYYETTVTSLAL